ncbi:Tetraticopeptide repeat domain containing protein [Hordeum vulgare]|nr:Tetraticopeptide repeat domain containing protein [Hordeum vulgare]
MLLVRSSRYRGMASTIWTTTSLGGKVSWGFSAGYHLMEARRSVALSGVVVASTANGPVKVNALITPEDGKTEDGGPAVPVKQERIVKA